MESEAPMKCTIAEEVVLPNAWNRFRNAIRDPAYKKKRLTLGLRVAQVVLALCSIILSSCYDLPRSIPVRVKAGGFILIDAGIIRSFFHFPAYVYLLVVGFITLLGALFFLLVLVVDLSLVRGASEHESIRFKIGEMVVTGLIFDIVSLIFCTTSACAVLGLTNVMHSNLTIGSDATSFNELRERCHTIFELKYAASSCLLVQSVLIGATLVLGWQHIEEKRKQMTQLGIPPQAMQQSIDKLFTFWKTIISGVGKRKEERKPLNPLFFNRIIQVLLSMAAFVCCYTLITDNEMEVIFDHVPPFQAITWISLAVLITSVGIAAVSAIDLSLTGGSKEGDGDGEGTAESSDFKGIMQSSSAQFKESLIYGMLIYDSVFSLLTFCTFSSSAGVTSADLNCSSGDSRWCALAGLGVFFVFMQSVSFMISLFTGSYVEFRDFRIKVASMEVHKHHINKSRGVG